MVIPEFWTGVLVTIFAELILIFAWAFYKAGKEQ